MSGETSKFERVCDAFESGSNAGISEASTRAGMTAALREMREQASRVTVRDLEHFANVSSDEIRVSRYSWIDELLREAGET